MRLETPAEQIEAGDKLIDELNDRDCALDLSIRSLMESMAHLGLTFATVAERPSSVEILHALDEMDKT